MLCSDRDSVRLFFAVNHRVRGWTGDAPAHDGSIEKLIELAEDRDEWRKRVHKLAPKKKVNKRAASTEEEEYKNHKQDMPWADSQKSQKHIFRMGKRTGFSRYDLLQ